LDKQFAVRLSELPAKDMFDHANSDHILIVSNRRIANGEAQHLAVTEFVNVILIIWLCTLAFSRALNHDVLLNSGGSLISSGFLGDWS
jgi:hypothetical protein